jgi:hypothetical protein
MDYKQFLNYTAAKKGLSPAILEDAMAKIAFHETGPKMRGDEMARQMGGGPGRGLFMFEMGRAGGAVTAVRRTIGHLVELGKEKGREGAETDPYHLVPDWLFEAKDAGSLDVAGFFTEEDQKYIFLGNYLEHPKANLAVLRGGDEALKQFWLNYHWAGPAKGRPARLKAFEASLAAYYKQNPKKAKKIAVKKSKMSQLSRIIKEEYRAVLREALDKDFPEFLGPIEQLTPERWLEYVDEYIKRRWGRGTGTMSYDSLEWRTQQGERAVYGGQVPDAGERGLYRRHLENILDSDDPKNPFNLPGFFPKEPGDRGRENVDNIRAAIVRHLMNDPNQTPSAARMPVSGDWRDRLTTILDIEEGVKGVKREYSIQKKRFIQGLQQDLRMPRDLPANAEADIERIEKKVAVHHREERLQGATIRKPGRSQRYWPGGTASGDGLDDALVRVRELWRMSVPDDDRFDDAIVRARGLENRHHPGERGVKATRARVWEEFKENFLDMAEHGKSAIQLPDGTIGHGDLADDVWRMAHDPDVHTISKREMARTMKRFGTQRPLAFDPRLKEVKNIFDSHFNEVVKRHGGVPKVGSAAWLRFVSQLKDIPDDKLARLTAKYLILKHNLTSDSIEKGKSRSATRRGPRVQRSASIASDEGVEVFIDVLEERAATLPPAAQWSRSTGVRVPRPPRAAAGSWTSKGGEVMLVPSQEEVEQAQRQARQAMDQLEALQELEAVEPKKWQWFASRLPIIGRLFKLGLAGLTVSAVEDAHAKGNRWYPEGGSDAAMSQIASEVADWTPVVGDFKGVYEILEFIDMWVREKYGVPAGLKRAWDGRPVPPWEDPGVYNPKKTKAQMKKWGFACPEGTSPSGKKGGASDERGCCPKGQEWIDGRCQEVFRGGLKKTTEIGTDPEEDKWLRMQRDPEAMKKFWADTVEREMRQKKIKESKRKRLNIIIG